jgi:hypothetical protein
MERGKNGNSHGMVRWHSPITMNLKITKNGKLYGIKFNK